MDDGVDPMIEEAKTVEIASASPQKEELVKQPKPLEPRDIDLYRHLISELDEPSVATERPWCVFPPARESFAAAP
ncbi:hypothetical protein [Stieleria varia]|uniref:hypothetical protein n=1 Tax=Stieleria varia TaxID=2528005 RepID=UPI0011B36A34|nr:hypothetical protein [Stieleria varia]